MFQRLGQFVVRHRLLVIMTWLAMVVFLRAVAPRWDSVTQDGDLAYLPATSASVRGEKLLAEAFPAERQKSQLVVIVERIEGSLELQSPTPPLAHATSAAANSPTGVPHSTRDAAATASGNVSPEPAANHAASAPGSGEESPSVKGRPRSTLSDPAEHALQVVTAGTLANRPLSDTEVFALLESGLRSMLEDQPQFIDVWSARRPAANEPERRFKEVVADRLRSEDGQAGLVLVQLSTEFMATANMQVLDRVLALLDAVRASPNFPHDRLRLGACGSAAVGADMLTAAKESIQRTEFTTVALVVLILLLVYRAPLLTVVPLITIMASVLVACDLVALLTEFAANTGAFEFKVFKTTKIFIVVILFGAGTDFCLFLISRFREELRHGEPPLEAAASALGKVGDALAASALTTVGGLAMMAFADFGKFRFSGPALALCLGVALAASCTLAPALISILGKRVFWPLKLEVVQERGRKRRVFWRWVSRRVTAQPGLILLACVLLLGPFAFQGLFVEPSYDLLEELHADRPSVRGTQILYRHFDRGDSGPVTVMALRAQSDFHSVSGEDAIYELTEYLAEIDGVARVRSLTRPLGDVPAQFGLIGAGEQEGRQMAAEKHYVSESTKFNGTVARFDIILESDPFSPQSGALLAKIKTALTELANPVTAVSSPATVSSPVPESSAVRQSATPTSNDQPGVVHAVSYASPDAWNWKGEWSGATFEYLGTTVATDDLRVVTTSDQRRIQVLCVIAVLIVMLVILRRPLICIYLIISVVFSFLVAIGATQLLFEAFYGASFSGLDWKVPLFLFVILVAIGEDYNIYLTTRVFEEQKKLGPLGGLRAGIERTGGIITSCGLIMAGTFISMMTGSLRGMLELGFALSLGVLLDTFLVRTILVPAFLALLLRWQHARSA